MNRSNRPPQSGDSDQSQGYPGRLLGLPERGSGSLAGLGRRLVALLADWFIAYGLARLTVTFGLMTTEQFLYGQAGAAVVLATWLVLGVVSVRLFQFTPGQFALGLRVASVDERQNVGLGRALARGVLIAFVIPALFVDVDGRGIQDRVTATAVVRR
ncbi:transporter [Mycobacterium sp. 1245111.1]|uniref:RDD family protein n=1 Tax=Mycobacterium sp. 1245111.1 TaxID=1834073 RepID=UPI0007FD9930|nr:RDD family protein [Mycobacterium sp. 1245111.1]OBK32062.1 transporter [Mycobacterium sp. 1245111.1]